MLPHKICVGAGSSVLTSPPRCREVTACACSPWSLEEARAHWKGYGGQGLCKECENNFILLPIVTGFALMVG